VREALASKIRNLVPVANTPLYEAVGDAFKDAQSAFDPKRINAVVVLSDGRNQDGNDADDRDQLSSLLSSLRSGSEGIASRSVRIFPIGYGDDADMATLRQIAGATSAAAYDASDPTTIDRILTAVISNF
jgi:Ca-activated chloride channel family protein